MSAKDLSNGYKNKERHMIKSSTLKEDLNVLELKHISLYKRALDLLVRPGDEKFVVMIGLEGTHIILKIVLWCHSTFSVRPVEK